MTILYRLTSQEALRNLTEGLLTIKSVSIEVERVTCDRRSNIIKVVRVVYPEAIIQRCVFHIANEINLQFN